MSQSMKRTRDIQKNNTTVLYVASVLDGWGPEMCINSATLKTQNLIYRVLSENFQIPD